MEIKLVTRHKAYNQDYVEVDNQVYSLKEAQNVFSQEDLKTLDQTVLSERTLNKPYKYPIFRKMKYNVDLEAQVIFGKLQLEKTKNTFENYKMANELLFYFISKISLNMSVIEDRLFHLKNLTYEIEEGNILLEKAYARKIYDKEKEYRRNKRALRKLEKQTKNQNMKMLFNTLIRKQSANQDEAYTFLYLLNELNIDSFKLTLENKKENKKHYVVLVPVKFNNYDNQKYYAYDITKYRIKLMHSSLQNKEATKVIKLYGKADLLKEYEGYQIISVESMKNVCFEKEPEFNKIVRGMAKESLEIIYNK